LAQEVKWKMGYLKIKMLERGNGDVDIIFPIGKNTSKAFHPGGDTSYIKMRNIPKTSIVIRPRKRRRKICR